MVQKMVISCGSCNGEEEEFSEWMKTNYPEIETELENTLDGGVFGFNEQFDFWERVDSHRDYWAEYCCG